MRRFSQVVPWWGWLAALFVVSVGARYLLARRDPGPWIFVDELIYSELARSLASEQVLAIRGVGSGGYGVLYPLLIAPAYALFDDLPRAFSAVKLINAVMMSSAAIPGYLLARRLVSHRLALLAAALVVAVPGMTYTGVVMTENLFYPLTVACALAMVLALERPTLLRQIVVFALLVLAYETRVQAVALLAAYPLAIAAFVLLEGRVHAGRRSLAEIARRLARWWPSWALLTAGVVVVVAVQLARGEPLRSLFGAYAVTADQDRLPVREVLRWLVYHVAELDLWLGVLPFLAMLLLLRAALERDAEAVSTRAFAAVALPVTLALALVVSMFNTSISNTRIEERNLFHVGALFLVALVWWVGRGLPRSPVRLLAAGGVAVALVGIIPYGSFINVSATSDTFALLTLWSLQGRLGLGTEELVALVVAVAVAILVVALVLPRRLAVGLPVIVLGFFAVSHLAVEGRTNGFAAATFAEGVRTAPNWIDEAVGREADVAVLWAGAPTPLVVWQNEFFNRSVGRVLTLGGPLPGALPETPVAVDPASGELRDQAGTPVEADYVLSERSQRLAGDAVAEDAGRGMTLLRTGGSVRLADQVVGVYGDAWSGPEATYTRYACSGGELTLVLGSDPGLFSGPQTVTALVGDQTVTSITVDPGGANTVATLPLTASAGACSLRLVVAPTAVPAQVTGSPDTRQLGVRVLGISYAPPA